MGLLTRDYTDVSIDMQVAIEAHRVHRDDGQLVRELRALQRRAAIDDQFTSDARDTKVASARPVLRPPPRIHGATSRYIRQLEEPEDDWGVFGW